MTLAWQAGRTVSGNDAASTSRTEPDLRTCAEALNRVVVIERKARAIAERIDYLTTSKFAEVAHPSGGFGAGATTALIRHLAPHDLQDDAETRKEKSEPG